MKKIPTIGEIKSQILADIDAAKKSAPILPRRFWDILAGAMAGSQYLLYRLAGWLHRQIFTSTMEADALEARGLEYGLSRKRAAAWKGEAVVKGIQGAAIPAGWLWIGGGQTYQTAAAVIDKSGQAVLRLKAIQAGAAGDLQAGAVLAISSPIIGVEGTATVQAVPDLADGAPDLARQAHRLIYQEGADAEDLEVFRARILARQREVPQGGAIPDFVGWATAVPGIVEAFVDRPQPGYVNIYPLKAGTTGRIPDKATRDQVASYVNSPRRYPFGQAASCLKMSEVSFELEISGLDPDTPALRAAIEAAVTAWLYARRPRQYTDQIDPPDFISVVELSGVISDTGAKNAVLTLKDQSGDISAKGYRLKIHELAKLGSLKWV